MGRISGKFLTLPTLRFPSCRVGMVHLPRRDTTHVHSTGGEGALTSCSPWKTVADSPWKPFLFGFPLSSCSVIRRGGWSWKPQRPGCRQSQGSLVSHPSSPTHQLSSFARLHCLNLSSRPASWDLGGWGELMGDPGFNLTFSHDISLTCCRGAPADPKP